MSGVAFASPVIGYLYGPALLMTTDGGRTWQAQPGRQVETLTVAQSKAYRVAYDLSGCPGPCQPSLQAAAIGSDAWHTLIGQLTVPDRSDTAEIVASGPSVLVAMYGSPAGPVPAQAIVYRSTDSGASWQRRADPCSGRGAGASEEDLTDLAAAPGGFYAGVCSPHTTSGTFVVTSANAGASWLTAGALPAGQDLALLAAASSTTLAAATGATGGSGSFTARLVISTDAGKHWTTAATDAQQLSSPAAIPAWLGFETAQVGRWISDPHSIWTTHDGGLGWTQTAFR